jgi:uncharacterized protein YbjT (DUF2867 family)
MPTNTQSDPRPILVTAASGKTGRRVAALLEADNHPVRRASRSAAVPFDWTDHSTFAPNLAGVRAAYIAYTPDLSVPRAQDDIRAFVNAAIDTGVERLVLLSGRGEPAAEACEQIIRESGLEYTLVRAAWFNQNFDEGDFLPMILDAAIALPAGDVAEPFIDADDIAEVAFAALTQPGHNTQLYEITGPRALTFHEVAQILSQQTGRTITYIPITMDQFKAGLSEAGVPTQHIALLEYVMSHTLDGRGIHPQDGVQRALGRPPKDFMAYVTQAAETGIWDPSACITESGVQS